MFKRFDHPVHALAPSCQPLLHPTNSTPLIGIGESVVLQIVELLSLAIDILEFRAQILDLIFGDAEAQLV